MSSQADDTGLRSLAHSTDNFSVWHAIGGIRGIAESIVPFLSFIIAYMASSNLGLSIGIVSFVLVVIVVVRLVQKQTLMGAASGLILTIVSVIVAMLSGSARSFYTPGILINALFLIVLFVSIIVGRPAIGWLMKTLSPSDEHNFMNRTYMQVTWVWIAVFAIRLIAEIPLYVARNIAALGIVRIITGIPLFAIALLVSWVIIKPARQSTAQLTQSVSSQEDSIEE
ncbi:DUF3159 domain-containing protein [Alloscardovia venturai]|uniref:DUF3159 domain-containing protein n=1 Tax=Alloscardovia venturai TaxID=1769421 RepID=A0ABW2Y4F1_9BIFI